MNAQQLRTVGIYEARAPLQSLCGDLERIGNLLVEIEGMRHKLRLSAGMAMFAGLACAIAAGVTRTNALSFCAFLAFTLGVILFIYSFVYCRNMHKHHDRYELMKELFRILLQDADKKAKFSVRLAMKAQAKLLREEPFLERTNGKQQFFAEDFLSIQGPLLDGTVLSETITELTRKRSYKNPRGKTKTKTRNRYALLLSFGYPADVYGDARAAHGALSEEIRVPPSARVRDVGVSEKEIAVKALVQLEREIPQTSAMVCMGAYRILNLARRGAP